MATRKFVYDDQDLDTSQYNGQWFAITSTEENIGNFGPPYLNTLHGTSHDANISFEFDGTTIEVYGTSIVANPKTNPDPNFECFVDGISIGREPVFEFPETNWKLCGKDGFSAGPHKLEIDIKVRSPAQTFWLDQIRYTPSPGIPLDHETILVTNEDPIIRLDDNWSSLGLYNSTSKMNATARVDFVGTSVTWVGYIPVELPRKSASGTYTIDDGEPVYFNLMGRRPDEKNSIYNQVFFTTMESDIGPHTLIVTFLGSEKTTPLTLDRLYINNGSHASPPKATASGITTITPGQTTVANSDARNRSRPNIDAIFGGVIGGLGLLIIIAGTILCRRHRHLTRKTLEPSTRGELASRYINPRGEFQTNVGPSDMPRSHTHSPIPSLKAQEPYIHTPIRSSPPKSLSVDCKEVFGSGPRTSHARSGDF